jgi:flagellar hook-length control protein FliK
LVQEAEGASRRSNPGEEAETSLNTQILFASRLSGREAPVEPRSASAVEMEGALGQTRAAIADMLERMQGEVRFDPANMRATIHLDPPALGRVQALVSIREDRQVFVTVSAENSDARDFLRQNESDLREQLERRGFSRDEISVEILDEDGNVFDRSIEGAVGAIS